MGKSDISKLIKFPVKFLPSCILLDGDSNFLADLDDPLESPQDDTRTDDELEIIGQFIADALNNAQKLEAENEKLKGILSGDPSLTATKEDREHWRLSVIRYADKLEAEISELRAANEWHYVSDGLPPKSKDYLITDRDGEIWECYFEDGHFHPKYDLTETDIIAWRELPQAAEVKA